jgi:hypothetical protein
MGRKNESIWLLDLGYRSVKCMKNCSKYKIFEGYDQNIEMVNQQNTITIG